MSFGEELTVCMNDKKTIKGVEVHVDMHICLC